MLQTDQDVDINVATPVTNKIRHAELHYTHGKDFIEVDVQHDKGRHRRFKRTITGPQQTTIKNFIESTINQALSVTVTEVPDPPSP